MANRGLRVLAAAADEGRGLRFLGLVGLEDPPREGVREAVSQAHRAGIRTIMITGDHGTTAAAIGARVGLSGPVITGAVLAGLSQSAFSEAVARTTVFARVSPEQKVRICDELIERGEIVAMTGDGVNDAPALRRAHVGVAMGKHGTAVAREAADIVLRDDHFATIIQAIAEGRRIADNIQRFVLFLLRANFDELLLIMTAVAVGLPVPYLPIHILWINLMTDGLPALALGAEPAEPDLMQRPARPPSDDLLSGQWPMLVFATLLGYGVILAFYLWRLNAGVGIEAVRSSTLTLAIVFELMQALSARSRFPLWQVGWFSNRWMLAAMATVLGAHALLLYTPLHVAFHLVPVPLDELAIIAGLGGALLLFFEGIKAVAMRRS